MIIGRNCTDGSDGIPSQRVCFPVIWILQKNRAMKVFFRCLIVFSLLAMPINSIASSYDAVGQKLKDAGITAFSFDLFGGVKYGELIAEFTQSHLKLIVDTASVDYGWKEIVLPDTLSAVLCQLFCRLFVERTAPVVICERDDELVEQCGTIMLHTEVLSLVGKCHDSKDYNVSDVYYNGEIIYGSKRLVYSEPFKQFVQILQYVMICQQSEDTIQKYRQFIDEKRKEDAIVYMPW